MLISAIGHSKVRSNRKPQQLRYVFADCGVDRPAARRADPVGARAENDRGSVLALGYCNNVGQQPYVTGSWVIFDTEEKARVHAVG